MGAEDQPFAVEGGAAWGSVLARYRPLALRVAAGIAAPDQAEDLVQEAARSILELARSGRARCATQAHARNYYLRAVHNHAVDALREAPSGGMRSLDEAPALEPPASGACAPESLAEEREFRALLQPSLARALAGLRTEERQAVELRYLEGLPFARMAARTGASISTLHSRVEAALQKIRVSLGKEGLRS